MRPPLKFAVIGIDHNHIYGMINGLLGEGAEFTGWATSAETPLSQCQRFGESYPDVPMVEPDALLDDASVQLIVSAAINDQRAGIAIAAMQAGKDAFVDKPGCTTLSELEAIRECVDATGRKWVVCFSERLQVESVTLADHLIREGRIGKVVQTVGLGPHRHNPSLRADWFWQRSRYGGILTDICAHQFDQFLHFTGSTQASVVTAHIGNVANPDRPDFQDFGEVLLEGNGGRGYARVDWLTPDGLPTWGDGRMTILGTHGTIELRKYIDIAGRPGKDHVFLADQKGVEHFDATGAGLPFFGKFYADIIERTEAAMTQAHAFLATQLALQAQANAESQQ
ncbi:Gfo/Idh/MocA family oxidoreductase [Rhizobium lemnae]|uniref:Gfo/Idh/MocA family protein n=1 Tax=Rhizobium lemnae TaxID=1214924 RepID=A0ABV8EDR5_9HYPH|nr:Gfo/Idh/MocA family oxidoreductase [Rhizobium lemnae]MCJ8510327.1 Gfo/Idh/MocA family oxidoreductase [Rhizobium lemnae]